MTDKKAEDVIINAGTVWSRVYKHRMEICLFVFLVVTTLASVIAWMVPDTEKYQAPSVFVGLAWGGTALVMCVMSYLGWWLYVGIFKIENGN